MAVPPVIEISSSPAAPSKTLSLSHRLPTVSASQAFQDLQGNGASYLPTGLSSLDSRLSDSSSNGSGGIERGKVTEIWGPTGAGKTAFALQTAAHAIKAGGAILWVDSATEVSRSRLKSVISEIAAEPSHPLEGTLKRFACLRAPTLSHLLAMILHMPPNLVSGQTSLLVIDDLNILVDLDYPRQQFANSARTEQQKWQSSRRYAVLGSIVSALNKLAVLNNFAIIVTTGCSTRMRPDSGLGAALGPGIGGTEWEAGTWNRLVVFRDFGRRFVGMQKSQGKSHISREEVGETGHIFAFEITPNGVVQECQPGKGADETITALAEARISPVKPRKRTFDEVADSDGEEVDEYGWAEADDDAVVAEGLIVDEPSGADNTDNGQQS